MAEPVQSAGNSPAPFCTDVFVRFGDCDPAGIVFYPRYFEMINNLVEDWSDRGLGVSFRELHMTRGLGLPTVHIETDFLAPSELGEMLRAELLVQKLGGASLTLAIRLRGPDGRDRVRASVVLALMDLKTRRAVPFPESLHARIDAFCIT